MLLIVQNLVIAYFEDSINTIYIYCSRHWLSIVIGWRRNDLKNSDIEELDVEGKEVSANFKLSENFFKCDRVMNLPIKM